MSCNHEWSKECYDVVPSQVCGRCNAFQVEEEHAELVRERDEARAEVATLADALDDIRHQRDRYHVELKQERAEVERMKREVSDARIALKAQEHRDQWLMAQSVGYGFYKRGAEAMRKRCAMWVKHNSHEDGLGMGSQRMESALAALPIPEDK